MSIVFGSYPLEIDSGDRCAWALTRIKRGRRANLMGLVMDFIQERWERNAEVWGADYSASWGDLFAIRLEIEAVGKHLHDGAKVLDVGCGNGFSLFEQCRTHTFKKITGIDFSKNMIDAANQRLRQEPPAYPVEFHIGDLRSLPFADAAFDVIYTTRALINLPTWQDQQTAILECLRVVSPGGKVVFSEAFWEPLVKLNAMRIIAGLSPLVEHDFNRYLKRSELDKFLTSREIPWTTEKFSSLYYAGTRLLREMVESDPKPTDYTSDFNASFFRLEQEYSGGDLGIQQLYVLQKP